MSRPALLALATTLLALPAPGASITWGQPQDTTGKIQLVEGLPVFAFSGGSAATVSGVGPGGASTHTFSGGNYQDLTFSPPPGARSNGNITNGAPSTGDADFDTIIGSITDSRSGITSGTQTIEGLSPGTAYRIQVFFNDQRPCCSGRVMTFGDGEAVPSSVNIAAAGSGWGQFAEGVFTADGPTQDLTHASNGFGNVHVNAILVVSLGPPARARTSHRAHHRRGKQPGRPELGPQHPARLLRIPDQPVAQERRPLHPGRHLPEQQLRRPHRGERNDLLLRGHRGEHRPGRIGTQR